jgi:tRNA threonylcarbamoyl adenosine modification protein (Sua5/YciO/YrdC/YwlC family)
MIVSINDPKICDWIKKGKVFIYPTDTIYGIGCDATNKEATDRIRKIKGTDKLWSVIAPGKKWVKEHCNPGDELDKLPGPFTFIYNSDISLPCRNGLFTTAIRIPDHQFSELVKASGVPFITTSVNKSGEDPITSVDQLSPNFLDQVDIIIDAGEIEGKPSTVIDYTISPPKILRQ